jgi:hypothetical protein
MFKNTVRLFLHVLPATPVLAFQIDELAFFISPILQMAS